MKNIFVKIKSNVFEILIALFLVLNFHSIYITSMSNNYYIGPILYILIALYLVKEICFFFYNKNENKKEIFIETTLKVLIITIFFLIYMYTSVSTKEIFGFLLKYIFTINSFFIIFSFNKKSFFKILKYISKIVIIIVFISLFLYIFGSILDLIKPSGSHTYKWGSKVISYSYYNIFFEGQYTNVFGNIIPRNIGVFTEAPVFSFMICLSLFIELFLLKQKNKFILIILFLCAFSTLSATGIVGTMIIFIMKILNNNKIKIPLLILTIIIGTIISITIVAFRFKTTSGSTRIDDIRAGYYAWLENPVFGNGYNNSDPTISYMKDFRKDNTGRSSGLMCVLSEGGIFMLSFYLYSILKVIIISLKNNKKLLLFFYLFILGFNFISIISYTNLIILFLAFGISYKSKMEDF